MNSICVGLKLGSFDGSKLNNLYRETINLNLPEGSLQAMTAYRGDSYSKSDLHRVI